MKDYPVRLQWRPFQLRPQIPPGGVPLASLMPAEYLAQAEARLREVLAEANLPFARSGNVPNTHLAHEAAAFAEAHGQGDAFHRAALRAYFGEAQDIGDPGVLADLGQSVGLDPVALATALAAGSYREAVDAALRGAFEAGITAVPAFVFGPEAVLSGAQPYSVFQRVMGALAIAPRP